MSEDCRERNHRRTRTTLIWLGALLSDLFRLAGSYGHRPCFDEERGTILDADYDLMYWYACEVVAFPSHSIKSWQLQELLQATPCRG